MIMYFRYKHGLRRAAASTRHRAGGFMEKDH